MARPVPAIYILATSMALVLSAGSGCREETPRPRVHVAASLAAPVDAELGERVDVSAASSFAIVRQVIAGMPADVVVLADPKAMDQLVARTDIDVRRRRTLGWNRLVVVVPGAEASSFHGTLDSTVGRIAIGDPDATPLGRYSRQSLERTQRWSALRDRLVMGGDARAVVSLVERGEVDLAVVYRSDAIDNPRLEIVEAIDPSTHDPILYEAAIVGGHPDSSAVQDSIATNVDWSAVGLLSGGPPP